MFVGFIIALIKCIKWQYFIFSRVIKFIIFEFVEFVKIFNEMNFDRADKMMKNSIIAMDIATKARMSAGVYFKADEAYE